MSEQKHIIKRQVIELEIQGAAEAQQLQDEVSRIYRRRIVPLIDSYCTELSQPDRVYRIDSLELDLGYLDPQRLEADLVAKFGAALRQGLAAQISAQEQTAQSPGRSPKTMSQLELLVFFARTGSLPWWADAAQPHILDECLEYLARAAPEPLRRSMRQLVGEERPLRRLVSHYADGLLALLSGALMPSFQPALARDLPALIVVLQKTRATASQPVAQLRRRVWASILRVAGMAGEEYIAVRPFYQAVLARVATELRVPYAALVTDIHHVVQAEQATFPIELRQALEALYRERPTASDRSRQSAVGSRQSVGRRSSVVGRRSSVVGRRSSARGWAALRALAPQLPAELQRELLAALNELEDAASTGSDRGRQSTVYSRQSAGRPPRARRTGGVGRRSSVVGRRSSVVGAAELRKLATAAGLSSRELAQLTQMLSAALNEPAGATVVPETAAIDISFSEADELYIGNAGLVILWPFLGHFFARLDLLDERQFKNPAARQRAVGLLQYIATEDAAFPEYLLPLNKALCGLDVDEVFDFGPPLSEAEAEECTDLLRAVIAQAPILRDMSVPGFRGTFLLRQGLLRARDGAWLLQVERETYDIVLDRFPWGWEWVRLPWMEAPLRVEWL